MPDAATEKTLIAAHELSRRYQTAGEPVTALESASFSLHAGERVALIGRSGSGKSTLLHLMAGLDTPSAGSITWPGLGAAESLLPDKVALVFQVPSLLEALTVAENVALPLLLSDDASGTDPAVARALAIFGLETLAQKLPEELSGGQMQRAAMARAIVGRPRLILADEPTGQLDQATAKSLLDALLRHLADSDTALVLATHDPAIAERMQTVWRMERGRLSTSPAVVEAP